MPTLYLTSHAKAKNRQVWTLMAYPRSWEIQASLGTVVTLVPQGQEVSLMLQSKEELKRGALFAGTGILNTYRDCLQHRWRIQWECLAPGKLRGIGWHGEYTPIPDGSILCCACAAGEPCHRVWAIPFLERAGWTVKLDQLPP